MNKLIVILIFLLTVFSCRKKEDTVYPSVQFISPANNSVHQVPNPVAFSVRASDETNLVSITVQLLNGNYTPVATSASLNCSNNDETFSHSIIPSDIHLSTGTYYLKAIASDGINKKVAYKEIHLLEVPRALHSVWISKNPNGSQVEIDSLDGTSFTSVYSILSDINQFEVNSYYGLFHVAGKNTGDFVTWQINNTNPLYTINNTGNGNILFFTSVLIDNNKTFVANRSGLIHSYQKTAQPGDVINLGGFYAESMCIQNDLIYVASVNSAGSQRNIQSYYIQSGILENGIVSTLETKKMFALSNNEILLFGNENNSGKIKLYNPDLNAISEPVVFTGGEIFDITSLGNNAFLIAHANGLEVYDHSASSLNTLISGNGYQLVEYDDLSSQVFLAGNNVMYIYSLSPFSLNNTITASDSIAGIGLLYNK